ncbi:OmpA/MotB family protein [Defluviitalea phaphyphila]|uniref:OmpA/MotB family protein n=1 Tax=Defluviitalea phaphyphila TaxID=1473580 RepID=UPI0007306AA1|nr:OmpA family protein [Defluviitalea phaphyphila]
MSRKKTIQEVNEGSPDWLNTYGDMVTLLLTFFVLLFSMSTIDIAKFKAFINSIEGSSGILSGGSSIGDGSEVGNGINQLSNLDIYFDKTNEEEIQLKTQEELKQMHSDLKNYIQENNLEEEINVTLGNYYVVLTFKDGVLFDSGKAELKPEAIEILNKIGTQLSKYADNRIRFEGHTDNRPINTIRFPSNWELSAARAIAVAKYYIDELGFDPKQFSTEGFGEYAPIADNNTEEGRAKNRRVEIKILSKYVSYAVETEALQ